MEKLISLSLLLLVLLASSCEESNEENENEGEDAQQISLDIMGGGSAPSGNLQVKSQKSQAMTTSATSLELKVYKIGLSTNGDCSNPEVFDLGGTYVDFMNTPNLGQGEISAANYKCVIIEMSDQIKFTPTANVGTNCTSGTEYTQDVCVFDVTTTSPIPNYRLLDGSEQSACSATDGTEDRVVMYLSVDSPTFDSLGTDDVIAYIYPPLSTDPVQITNTGDNSTINIYGGFHLTASFNAMSDGVGIFYMDATDKVSSHDSENTCFIDVPVFGFYLQ